MDIAPAIFDLLVLEEAAAVDNQRLRPPFLTGADCMSGNGDVNQKGAPKTPRASQLRRLRAGKISHEALKKQSEATRLVQKNDRCTLISITWAAAHSKMHRSSGPSFEDPLAPTTS
jgi:hypothetical protein